MLRSNIILLLCATVSVAIFTPAFADNPPVNNSDVTTPLGTTPKVYVRRTYEHHDAGNKDTNYQPNLGRPGEIKINTQDREILAKYVAYNYKNTCPWEHDYRFKKCIEPRITDKNYMIGYGLKSGTTYTELPRQVIRHLREIPAGYKYVLVENDVLLINTSNREVIDAVTLMLTYGK